MSKDLLPMNSEDSAEFLLYQTEDGQTRVQVRFLDETVWLTQKQLAELFQKDVRTINEHIQNVFEEGELEREATIRKFRIVQTEGKRQVERDVDHYNLDVIISVGYRVRSHRGTQFRQWATKQLRELIITRQSRINCTGQFMDTLPPKSLQNAQTRKNQTWGLTTWKNAPKGRIRKSDIHIAKNYLTEEEISNLNLIVDQYLSFAELQERQRKTMTMAEWKVKLDNFLTLNDRDILTHAGVISAEEAKAIATQEYEKYEAERRRQAAETPVSDFDAFIERVKKLPAQEE
jgi:hypothetical protein